MNERTRKQKAEDLFELHRNGDGYDCFGNLPSGAEVALYLDPNPETWRVK